MAFNYWGETDKGAVRLKNEDAFEGFICNNTLFLIIADGFGISDDVDGQVAGVVAVHEAKRFIETFYTINTMENLERTIRQCIYSVNRVICGYKKANFDKYSGYGSSITILGILHTKEAVICHMGNTRLYLLRQGQIIQGTKDHTQAQKLLEKGSITEAEYMQHPERVILTNGLGYSEDINADILMGTLIQGDFVVLLSDGIYNLLSKEEIASLVFEAGELATAAKWLVKAAKDRGGFDNLTALISYINF